jgi:cytochrome c peroxidase
MILMSAAHRHRQGSRRSGDRTSMHGSGGCRLRGWRRLALLAIILSTAAGWCLVPARARADSTDELLQQARQFFAPLPKDFATAQRPITPASVELGRTLFFDPRVSVAGTTSCVRCHLPSFYGTDALPKSHGNHDRLNLRNAPTVLNAAAQFKIHWTGNREDVEDQAVKALIGPLSFGNPNLDAPMNRLKAIPGYLPLFQKAFPGDPDPINPANFGKAVGAFERTLATPSRFDAFLEGDSHALTAEEREGLRTFIGTGCIACHNGVGVGGGQFQKFGLVEEYWKATGSKDIDEGRYLDTKKPEDKYAFKVSSLRNVAMTGPYFHDGSVFSLEDAVRVMARVQLGKRPSDTEVRSIAAFLGSLTGELPRGLAEASVLPAER